MCTEQGLHLHTVFSSITVFGLTLPRLSAPLPIDRAGKFAQAVCLSLFHHLYILRWVLGPPELKPETCTLCWITKYNTHPIVLSDGQDAEYALFNSFLAYFTKSGSPANRHGPPNWVRRSSEVLNSFELSWTRTNGYNLPN